jgi:hypothetical protein
MSECLWKWDFKIFNDWGNGVMGENTPILQQANYIWVLLLSSGINFQSQNHFFTTYHSITPFFPITAVPVSFLFMQNSRFSVFTD